ncbi:MAG: glycoside hydrolase family 28 protein [Bacteroidota bacterium]|nr:glycoside hydrolase family 28 protein [Bacteroidota bacterium]MDP4273219.1 glycoside hydrolase family 28 protein [Bacteroidota bacterium]
MKSRLKSILVISLGVLSTVPGLAQFSGDKVPFDMPEVKVPVFKTDTFNVKDYGAENDGITLNTKAFAKAIDACSAAGGGVVLIPEGCWLTGPIVLKSNVNLHTTRGTLVKFSRNFDDYPIVQAAYEGIMMMRCASPVSGKNLQNVAITGYGIFEGSGDAWRSVKREKLTPGDWKSLITSGGILSEDKNTWYPSKKYLKGNAYPSGYLGPNATIKDYEAIKDFLRPVMVSFIQCNSVLLDGPTFQNSPSWCIHPLLCENLTLRNVTVRNPQYAQNGDGIDVESCRIGTITNCSFDAGDDGICIKSGKNAEGRKRGKPTEYFVISNNVVFHGHGGFVIGSEMSGGVRNIFVHNCCFVGTDIGLRFKSTRGRGGVVENIYVSGIAMINIPTTAILFDMFYGGASPIPEGGAKVENNSETITKPVVDEGTPRFENFFIKDISCNGADQAILVKGLPEMSIRNISLENISIKSKRGFSCINGDHVKLTHIKLDIENGDAGIIKDSKNVDLSGFSCNHCPGKLLRVSGAESENISISGNNINKNDIEMGREVKSKVNIH